MEDLESFLLREAMIHISKANLTGPKFYCWQAQIFPDLLLSKQLSFSFKD